MEFSKVNWFKISSSILFFSSWVIRRVVISVGVLSDIMYESRRVVVDERVDEIEVWFFWRFVVVVEDRNESGLWWGGGWSV